MSLMKPEIFQKHRVLTALPVYNEARHVDEVLGVVRKFSDDIVVVNDGSTDDTAETLARHTDIHVITHEKNAGYGAGLRSAFLYAIEQGYDALVTIDCDGQHEPRLIPEMVAALYPENGEVVDIVSGSRYLQRFPGDSLPPADRRRINMEITEQLNRELGLQLTDTFCGFKAYRVESLKVFQITDLGYAMPLQLWVQAVAAGLKIVEFAVPLVYLEEERSFGGSLDDSVRRKAHYQQVIRQAQAEVGMTIADPV